VPEFERFFENNLGEAHFKVLGFHLLDFILSVAAALTVTETDWRACGGTCKKAETVKVQPMVPAVQHDLFLVTEIDPSNATLENRSNRSSRIP
jgi:hypothetical protein